MQRGVPYLAWCEVGPSPRKAAPASPIGQESTHSPPVRRYVRAAHTVQASGVRQYPQFSGHWHPVGDPYGRLAAIREHGVGAGLAVPSHDQP